MKKYSKEFKDSTVQLIINNNENVKKVAKDLDINPVTLYGGFRETYTVKIFNMLRYLRITIAKCK